MTHTTRSHASAPNLARASTESTTKYRVCVVCSVNPPSTDVEAEGVVEVIVDSGRYIASKSSRVLAVLARAIADGSKLLAW